MRRVARLSGYGRWTWLVAGLLLWGSQAAQAQAVNARMQKVVAKFVEKTGGNIMAVGSWISGQAFNPGKSDFDMRLILPQGGTTAEQLAKWKSAQTELTTLIKAEFGQEAGNILSRTNLYAPGQLMQGVENTADAMERFQQLGRVPSLAHTGPVTENTAAQFAEGLYGQGAQVNIQAYEKTAGRLFYNNQGKCVTGLSELAHLGEGTAKYTAAGTANTAGQWAEKCLHEITSGRGEKVAKYLERLERDLTKSRSLSGLPLDDAFRAELNKARELLKRSPGQLGEVAENLTKLVSRGQAEAAILGSFENAGTVRRAYLRVMLDGVAAKNKLGQLLERFVQALPSGMTAENAMNALVVLAGTQATAQAAGRGDTLEALGAACSHLKWVTAFGPMLVAELTTEILREAIASGYDMAAGSQEAWDLMAGVYSAWGRADVDPDPRRSLTLADLVANFQSESKLEAIVYAQCLRASTRDLGAATGQADEGVALSIFAKCWPVIRDAWRWQRDILASEYLLLGSEIVHGPLLVYFSPKAPQPGNTVTCEARSFDGKLGDRLDRMQQIIRTLYGKGSGIAVDYNWLPAGTSAGDRDWQRAFKFGKPGKYPVLATLQLSPYTNFSPTEPRIMLRRTVSAMVEVEVGGTPEICRMCGKPIGTSPNCMLCTLARHDPTKDAPPAH